MLILFILSVIILIFSLLVYKLPVQLYAKQLKKMKHYYAILTDISVKKSYLFGLYKIRIFSFQFRDENEKKTVIHKQEYKLFKKYTPNELVSIVYNDDADTALICDDNKYIFAYCAIRIITVVTCALALLTGILNVVFIIN